MRETRAKGKRRGAGGQGLRAPSIVLGSLALVVVCVGCGGLRGNQQVANNTNDPLLGGGAPASPSALPAGSPPAPVVPPAPQAPTSLTSNAALTLGTPLADRNPDLHIGSASAGQPPAGQWSGANAGTAQWSGAPGAATILRQPEPVYDSPPRQDAMVQPASAPHGETYEQLQAQLAARGVTWQQLQTSGDHGWKFSCSIPNRQNPAISHTYEATAATDLAAIRAALDQIGKEQP